MSDYRDRIYDYYVHARQNSFAPASLTELEIRGTHLNKVIRDHFPRDRDASIVDVGCGYGAFLYFGRKAGYRNMIGIDRSPQQLTEAKRLGIEGVRQGDLLEFLCSLPNDSQDCVIVFDVIEHFRKDELMPFIDEILRVLKRAGRCIIHVPNGEAFFGARIRYDDFTHELAFTRTSLGQLLLSSGFERLTCYEDRPIPHGIISLGRYVCWRIIRLILRIVMAVETSSFSKDVIFSQSLLAVAFK